MKFKEDYEDLTFTDDDKSTFSICHCSDGTFLVKTGVEVTNPYVALSRKQAKKLALAILAEVL